MAAPANNVTMTARVIQTSSNGVFQGDDPLHFAFPLLILQTLLIVLLSRLLAVVLRPLRQPKVIAEIIAGILLGPSALGRSKLYLTAVFPSWSTPILESVANIGLVFFLFLVGLELDLRAIKRSGRAAVAIAAAGISLPFACGVGVAFVLRSAIPGAANSGYSPFLVFMGVSLSITAFPVLARILAELKLLTTRIGETAMAAAAFNDVAAWVLLALAVAISGSEHRSPAVSAWVLLCGAAFVAIWMLAVRPAMAWVSRRAEGGGEVWVALTLAGVLASGFMTDFIGIHAIFGAFVFGLVVPKDGEFAERLTQRIEDFVSGLLLPLYFSSSGLKTDITSIHGGEAWALLALVIATACAGKIAGTMVAALICRIPPRDALLLGVMMNTKGLVELIVLNIGRERKVLNDEMFAILVLMALFTTFITTPALLALRKAAGGRGHRRKLHNSPSSSPPPSDPGELRVLACVHAAHDVHSLINLIEIIRGGEAVAEPRRRLLKLYILRLVELTERSSSILLAHAARRNGLPFFRGRTEFRDEVAAAFDTYAQLGRARVRTMTAISALATMQDDVCAIAEEKRASLILLPYHKHKTTSFGDADGMENVGHGWRAVNRRILRDAPCSVCILVDRGLDTGLGAALLGVCVIFFGGPDDREALVLAGRMAEHPGVRVTAVRFTETEQQAPAVTLRPSETKSADKNYTFSTAVPDMDPRREKELDEASVGEFREKAGTVARYMEREPAGSLVQSVMAIGRSGEYALLVVGKGRFPSAMVAKLAARPAGDSPELGPIGDALAAAGHGVTASVLVVQQHDASNEEDLPVTVLFDVEANQSGGAGKGAAEST